MQWLLVLLWGWLWLALATHTAADLAASPHAWPSFLLQVLSTAARVGVPMSGENALQRYDQCAFDKICDSAFGQSVMAGRLEVRARVCVWRIACLSTVVINSSSHLASPCCCCRLPAPLPTAHCCPPHLPLLVPCHLLQKLTFLRMGDMMIDNWTSFGAFLQRLTCPAQP